MSAVRLFAPYVLPLLSCVHGAIHGRDLPYLNASLSTTAALSGITIINSTTIPLSSTSSKGLDEPPYPISGTGFFGTEATGHNGFAQPTDSSRIILQSASRNTTVNISATDAASCTVNIPSASLDWWYAATYLFPTAQLLPLPSNDSRGSGLVTVIPNTETWDPIIALTEDAYVEVLTYDEDWDITWTYYEQYMVKPTAAATSVISRQKNLAPTVEALPIDDIFQFYQNGDLPPATAAIGVANEPAVTATSATPVLFFSNYEVETTVPTTGLDGLNSSTVITRTVDLSSPHAYSYWFKGIESTATAVGPVPSDFLQQIPESSCNGGQVQAVVTVLFVVDLYLGQPPNAGAFIIHLETTATGWEDQTRVNVWATGLPNRPPVTLDIPFVLHTADGFMTATKDDVMRPAGGTPDPTTDANGKQNGNGSPGQGPNVPEPTQKTVGTIGGNPVVIGPSSAVIIGTQTLSRGGPAVTVGGVPVSLVPSGTAIVVGGATSKLPNVIVPTAQPKPPPILTIGSSTLTPNAATQFLVAPGQTLTPGGKATLSGTVISLDPSVSFIVIGGSTQDIPTPAPVFTSNLGIVLGGSTIAANPGSTFVISGQTLVPGKAITVDGTTVSLDPQASFVVINGKTSEVKVAQALYTPKPEIVVGGTTFTGDTGSTFVISGQTLTPGKVITVDGTTISLPSSGSFVVINGVTSTFTNAPAAHITPPPLTIGRGVFTALPGTRTAYLIGGSTLTPGGVITVAGTTISLAPGATAIIVDGQTTMLTPEARGPITNAPLLTIGTNVYTALYGTGTAFIISGQTLTPGGTILVDGTTVSLAPGATQLIYGSSGHMTTTALFPATTTRAQPATAATGASAGGNGGTGGPAATSTTGTGSTTKVPGFGHNFLPLLIGLFCLASL